jgi:predicted RNA-binding protein with PUA-like domain
MALWLFKEEPTHYGYGDLEREGQAVWEGVRNALALKHLRNVQRGDRILYYHTGKEKAVVGAVKAISAKDGVVAVAPVHRLARPVTLREIKADPTFKNWELVRISRLSVMPVTAAQWKRIEELAQVKVATKRGKRVKQE